jgi:hypothetical protein
MKLTNKFDLPEPFVKAIAADEYVRGTADFTTTELIRPTRIVSLRRKHDADLEEDASDRVWALQGQAKHVVFERIAKTDPTRYIVEERYEVTMPGGVKISGQIDLFDKNDTVLYDWKETSVWKFMLGDTKEWEEQANVNCYLMRMNGIFPKKLINIAILKDWKKRKARFGREPDYPKCAIHVLEMPMWSIGQQQDYILKRIIMHKAGMENPPVCTKKERWQRDATFAVMRADRKRAIKLCDNRDQAEAVMMHHMKIAPPGLSSKFYIEERGAEPVRCLDFCEVQQYCDFGIAAEEKWKIKNAEPEKSNTNEK